MAVEEAQSLQRPTVPQVVQVEPEAAAVVVEVVAPTLAALVASVVLVRFVFILGLNSDASHLSDAGE